MEMDNGYLGGGFKYILFSARWLWEMTHFDEHIFQMGWSWNQLTSYNLKGNVPIGDIEPWSMKRNLSQKKRLYFPSNPGCLIRGPLYGVL